MNQWINSPRREAELILHTELKKMALLEDCSLCRRRLLGNVDLVSPPSAMSNLSQD